MNKQNPDARPSSRTTTNQSSSLADPVGSSLPEGWQYSQEDDLGNRVYLSDLVEQHSHQLIRLLGYGLLVFALVDYAYILIPLRLTDPNWELQAIGVLVEHAALPLLGLLFVFYRRQGYVTRRESYLLRFLSWISLLVGLLYLLMLPLGAVDTWRINQSNNAQITAQLSQQRQQLQQVKGELNQATDAQLQQLAASLASQGRLPQAKNPQAPRKQFLGQVDQTEQDMQVQADQTRTNQRQVLIKNSVKWNLGALIAGTLFVWIWRLTDWARIRMN